MASGVSVARIAHLTSCSLMDIDASALTGIFLNQTTLHVNLWVSRSFSLHVKLLVRRFFCLHVNLLVSGIFSLHVNL